MSRKVAKTQKKNKPYTPVLVIPDYESGYLLEVEWSQILLNEQNNVTNAQTKQAKVTASVWLSIVRIIHDKIEAKLDRFGLYPKEIKLEHHEAITFYTFMLERKNVTYHNFICEIDKYLIA